MLPDPVSGPRARPTALAVGAAALLAAAVASGARADPPALPFGTWHVLVHYHRAEHRAEHRADQRAEGPDPGRWLWDERVWVIEPSGDGLEWTEHAIVAFRDESGRFADLGTNMARRLVGAWTPNAGQQEELATGVTVSSRGMLRQHLVRVGDSRWRSDPRANEIGRSAGGVAYHETWSIASDSGGARFRLDSRFEVQVGTESAGATEYRVEGRDGDAWTGRYEREGDRAGRFRMIPTRILVAVETDPSQRLVPPAAGHVELVPDHRIHSDVPLLVSVLRPLHYYGDRTITVDSTPPGAELDLAYLRRGSQLVYRRGVAPLEVKLPTRLQTDASDRVLVRGFLPGHERTRRSFDVSSVGDHVQLDLLPLPNQLLEVEHGHVAGRSVLELVSREEPTVRIAEDAAGFTVVFLRTGLSEDPARRLESLRDPLLAVRGRQLGEDLVVRLENRRLESERAVELELRHEVRADPARDSFRTRLLVSDGSPARRVERLRLALAAADPEESRACASPFESALRVELDETALLASLGRDDHAERPTLRAALRRLVESAPGRPLALRGGAPLSVGSEIEFELAWSRRTQVEGYLAWLHELAARIEGGGSGARALRSFVAPAWSDERFAALLATAVADRADCLARGRAT